MSDDRNAHASRPWPEADRRRQLADIREWREKYRRGPPCEGCGSPFPCLCTCGASRVEPTAPACHHDEECA